jgi:hypothetical protein
MINLNLVGNGLTSYRPDGQTTPTSGSFAAMLKQQNTSAGKGISPTVQAANIQTFGDSIGAAVNTQGYVAIDQIRTGYQEKLAAFQDKLGNLFRDEHIATEPAPKLQINKEGKVEVVGEHPDKARIEALFAERPDLRQQFASLSSDAVILQAYDSSKTKAASLNWAFTFDSARMQVELSQTSEGRLGWTSTADKAAQAYQKPVQTAAA